MKLIPCYTEERKVVFADTSLTGTTMVNVEGVKYITAPLAIGKQIDLLGVSMNDALLEEGLVDFTDKIHPVVTLKYVFLMYGGTPEWFPASAHADSSWFFKGTEGPYKILHLDYTNVMFQIHLCGTINIETGECIVDVAKDSNPDFIVFGYDLDCERG